MNTPQVMVVLHARRPPDLAQQHAMGEHPASVGHQHAEQLEFDRRQVHLTAALADDAGHRVEDDIADAGDALAACRQAAVAPHVGAYPGQELGDAKRFLDVVVGAGIEGAHLVLFFRARREHEDGHPRTLRTAAISSTPSPSGRPRSTMTRLGRAVRASASPSRTVSASRTRQPSASSAERTKRRMLRSSSTSRRSAPARLRSRRPLHAISLAGVSAPASTTGGSPSGRVKVKAAPPLARLRASMLPP